MFMRTERLLLRPGWIEDARALAEALADPAIVRNLARVRAGYTIDDARQYLSLPADLRRPTLLIFARTLGQPRLVGGVGVHDDADGHATLGYWIARRYWGLGFATEAGRAMMLAADSTLGIERLRAECFIDNPASAHVLAKLGFRATGARALRRSAARDAAVEAMLFDRERHAAAPRREALLAA